MSEENAAIETGQRYPDQGAAGVGGAGTHPEDPAEDPVADADPAPNWWHRDHPTFASLAGFYTGLLFIIVVPGAFAGILAALVGQDRGEELFPLVLVTLVIPLALLFPHRTRRFGRFMWLGIVSTFVVVVGVAALVLWFMVEHTG
jgi:hypothetical protein